MITRLNDPQIDRTVDPHVQNVLDTVQYPLHLGTTFNRSTGLAAPARSSLGTFQQNLISSADYEEMGPCIVHRRCA